MSEHNLFNEIDEDLERQRLEALWKRYGGYVMAVALAVIVMTGIVTYWNSYHQSKDQATTATLVQLENPIDTNSDSKKQVESLKAFADKNPDSSQALFAQFHAAALTAQNGDKAAALKIYDSIAHNAKADSAFRQYADLQAARIQMDSGNPADLIQRLQPLTDENATWRFSAMELQGYLAIKAGDKDKARKLFTELAQNASAPHSLAQRASDMLHYVSE